MRLLRVRAPKFLLLFGTSVTQASWHCPLDTLLLGTLLKNPLPEPMFSVACCMKERVTQMLKLARHHFRELYIFTIKYCHFLVNFLNRKKGHMLASNCIVNLLKIFNFCEVML